MSWFTKTTDVVTPPPPSELLRRARKLSGNELLDWCEAAMYPIGRGLSDYRKGLNPNGLDEAVVGAEGLLAVLVELQSR